MKCPLLKEQTLGLAHSGLVNLLVLCKYSNFWIGPNCKLLYDSIQKEVMGWFAFSQYNLSKINSQKQ